MRLVFPYFLFSILLADLECHHGEELGEIYAASPVFIYLIHHVLIMCRKIL